MVKSPVVPHLLCAILLVCLFGNCSATADDELAAEEAAIKAIRGWTSNIQKNRDGAVRFVRFSKPKVVDEHLTHLKAFKHIDYLAVITPTITDAGLANISGLSNLDTLFVSGTQLTDAGMPAVRDLKKLERLYLDGTNITDAGLVHLEGLLGLKSLSLQHTQVTDAGLQHLLGLAKLEVLILSDTAVTDAGLERLGELKTLKTLNLERTKVTGNALASLKSLEKLETLNLSGVSISAPHLDVLTQFRALKQVLLYQTPIKPTEVATLRKRLPKTGIHLSPAKGKENNAFQRFLARTATRQQAAAAVANSIPQAGNKPILGQVNERFAKGDEVPDFQRHVLPMLGRLGCNGRTCHGSFQGQGGFRLSMFGYDFETDIKSLGERIDGATPEDSLILKKPTMQVDHGGEERFKKGGWEYNLLLRWIKSGAKGLPKEAARFVRLDVTPAEFVFDKAGQTVQLNAVAVWSDGTREDVTCLTRFQTNDETVAEVTEGGLIRSKGAGDTYVISFYDNGIFSTQTILPLSNRVGDKFPAVPTPTSIDELVVAKLSKLGVVPSELCSDTEFLRRVGLDLAGTLPTPEEIGKFVADSSPDKRARKIDELLERPAYVEWWTNQFCDLTGTNAQHLGSTDMNRPAANQWTDWIRRRIRDNIGWDEIVAGILLARSRRPGQTYEEYAAEQSAFMRRGEPEDYTAHDNPMHYYWFRGNLTQPMERALSFGYIFLGVRLQCAQCHKHPYDQWSQQDFEQFTAFFSRIKSGVAPDAAESQRRLKTKLGVPVKLDTAALRRQMYMRVAAEGKPIPWNEIYIQPPGGKPQTAKLLGGEQIDLNAYDDPREPLMDWLMRRDNPYFAAAFVNRIWTHYFGIGIVDPPDDFNMANPPSNKALLEYLAREFVNNNYDMKWLHRTITASRTYQLGWRPNDTNRRDERNFSHAQIRRLPAEVVVDAILQATSNDKKMQSAADDVKKRKIAQHPLSIQARSIDYSLLVFGKPLRTTNCDCERQMQPSLLQSLFVRNDHELLQWLERNDGWLAQIAGELNQTLSREVPDPKKSKKSKNKKTKPGSGDEPTKTDVGAVDSLIETAYVRCLSRPPNDSERSRAHRHVLESENTVEGLRDLMWVLLNTQEFVTNH